MHNPLYQPKHTTQLYRMVAHLFGGNVASINSSKIQNAISICLPFPCHLRSRARVWKSVLFNSGRPETFTTSPVRRTSIIWVSSVGIVNLYIIYGYLRQHWPVYVKKIYNIYPRIYLLAKQNGVQNVWCMFSAVSNGIALKSQCVRI